MKRTLLVIALGVSLAATAEARRKSKKTDIEPAEKPPIEAPPSPAPPVVPGGGGVGAEVHLSTELAVPPPPPPVMTAAPPQMVVVGRRPFWELAVGGGAAVGGAYVLSVLVGAFSYAGFYDGQWGWFIPLAGPSLAMAGVGGEPAGCLSKAAYTYSLGPILTLVYLGGIATAIAGAVAKKDVVRPAGAAGPAGPAPPPAPALQVSPTVGPNSAGMILLGTF